MRKDITMDVDNGDLSLRRRPPAYSSKLTWVDEDDFHVFGECILEDHLTFNNLIGGIGLYVEQKDSVKPIRIKFSRITGKGEKVDTGYLPAVNIAGVEITGAKLPTISDLLFFRVYLPSDGDQFTFTCGYNRDLNIDESKDQNEYFLLIANPSSIYANPLTGVGIRSYLNGDIRTSDLPTKIQNEYDLDGMTVNSIKYDEITNEIVTETTER